MFQLDVRALLLALLVYYLTLRRIRLINSHMLFCEAELVQELFTLVLLLSDRVSFIQVPFKIGLVL